MKSVTLSHWVCVTTSYYLAKQRWRKVATRVITDHKVCEGGPYIHIHIYRLFHSPVKVRE